MKSTDLLKLLPTLFRSADVGKFTRHPEVFLSRANKEARVLRLMKGAYLNLFKCEMSGVFPEVEEVACFLKSPAYVSCEWALYHHRVLIQAPMVCTAVTLNYVSATRSDIKYHETEIEFSRISQKLFWGFVTDNLMNMATAEKALADAAYLRKRIPFADELDLDQLDLSRLADILQQYPGTTRNLVKTIL